MVLKHHSFFNFIAKLRSSRHLVKKVVLFLSKVWKYLIKDEFNKNATILYQKDFELHKLTEGLTFWRKTGRI